MTSRIDVVSKDDRGRNRRDLFRLTNSEFHEEPKGHRRYVDLVSTTATDGLITWSEYAAAHDCDGNGDSNKTEDCSENKFLSQGDLDLPQNEDWET